MCSVFTKIKNFQIVRWGIPLAIFLLCALTFGPLITQLGFYWDDWPVIDVYKRQDGCSARGCANRAVLRSAVGVGDNAGEVVSAVEERRIYFCGVMG